MAVLFACNVSRVAEYPPRKLAEQASPLNHTSYDLNVVSVERRRLKRYLLNVKPRGQLWQIS